MRKSFPRASLATGPGSIKGGERGQLERGGPSVRASSSARKIDPTKRVREESNRVRDESQRGDAPESDDALPCPPSSCCPRVNRKVASLSFPPSLARIVSRGGV